MKKMRFLYLFIITFVCQQAMAQFISVDSIKIMPMQPVRNDTVMIDLYVSLICVGKNLHLTHQLNGNTIDIEGCYTVSGATANSFFHDTLKIGPLNDGIYYINYRGYASLSYDSCTVLHLDSTIMNDTFVVNAPTSIDAFSIQAPTLYPNPVKNILRINASMLINKACIYSIFGKPLAILSPKHYGWDVSFLPPGIYFLCIITDKEKYVERFVKE